MVSIKIIFSKKTKREEEKARQIAEDIIDFLEIEEYRYSYILSLPYGIQKRIELARALQ
jgi:branched-chain amino acid transport system ATP-binding protein